jgi:hypothetical protein
MEGEEPPKQSFQHSHMFQTEKQSALDIENLRGWYRCGPSSVAWLSRWASNRAAAALSGTAACVHCFVSAKS